MRKMHYSYSPDSWVWISICGLTRVDGMATKDPKKVTCKNCLRALSAKTDVERSEHGNTAPLQAGKGERE